MNEHVMQPGERQFMVDSLCVPKIRFCNIGGGGHQE